MRPWWFRLVGFSTVSPLIWSHEHPVSYWWTRHMPAASLSNIAGGGFLLPSIFPQRNVFASGCVAATTNCRYHFDIVRRCWQCRCNSRGTRCDASIICRTRLARTFPIGVTTTRMRMLSFSFFNLPRSPAPDSNRDFVVEIPSKSCHFLRSLGVL